MNGRDIPAVQTLRKSTMVAAYLNRAGNNYNLGMRAYDDAG